MTNYSEPERMVKEWLDENNIIYREQVNIFGGRTEKGGAIVDFIISDVMIAIRVQGEYWHIGTAVEARDNLQKEMLTAQGYTVVDIQEEEIYRDVDYVMRKALQGEEI